MKRAPPTPGRATPRERVDGDGEKKCDDLTAASGSKTGRDGADVGKSVLEHSTLPLTCSIVVTFSRRSYLIKRRSTAKSFLEDASLTYTKMVRKQRCYGPGDEHRQAECYCAADALGCGNCMTEAKVELVRDEIQVQSSRADHKDQGRHLNEWSGRETSPYRGEGKPNRSHRSVPGTTTSL